MSNEIKANMKILLEIEYQANVAGAKNILSLGSYVEEVMENGGLLVQMPIHDGDYYTPPHDKPILICYFVESRMFTKTVHFHERVERDGLIYAVMHPTAVSQADNRKDSYRMHTPLPITLGFINKNTFKTNQLSECRIVNFSSGGMLIRTDEILLVGEIITLTFAVGAIETVKAKVLRHELMFDGQYLYKVAVKFLINCEKRKDRFSKFIAERQQEKLNKASN